MTSRKFRVLVYGYDPTASIGADGPSVGFWTTRYLEASTRKEAADRAVGMVLAEDRLTEVVKHEWAGQLVVRAQEVDEVESFEGISLPGGGYTFFDEADEPQ